MLRRVIALSINHAPWVLLAAGVLLVVALRAVSGMPVDVFPELQAPTVVLLTEAGGLTATEVEQQVSMPLESAMSGLPGGRRVRSASALGLSLVWVEFRWGEDPYRARQVVTERLATVAQQLPEGARPSLGPMTSITGEIQLISLRPDPAKSSDFRPVSPLQLRSLAETVVRPHLLSVHGVSQVVAIGGRLPQHRVVVDQGALLARGMHLSDVLAAASQAHSTAPAGYLADVRGVELAIPQDARARRPEDIGAAAAGAGPLATVPLRAVAEIRTGGAPRRGAAADDGVDAVVLSIQKAPGENTLALTARIDAALNALAPRLPAGVVLNRHAFRQADFIERAVAHVRDALRDAVIIVAIVLLLLLVNGRAALVTLTALPLSLAVAVLVLDGLGMTLNVMTLGGLAVAIGELVDDAVIDVENVLRRLRENAGKSASERKHRLLVIFEASDEIRRSVVFATLIICVVFLPMMQLSGLEGRFFVPLGAAYVAAVMASLGVALTVTPALCRVLLRADGPSSDASSAPSSAPSAGHGPVANWLVDRYVPLLDAALRHGALVITTAAAASVLALAVASTFGSSFLPTFSEGSLTVFLMAPPGTSLVESDRLGRGVEHQLARVEGVQGVIRRTGRAERDEHAEPPWSSELDVRLEPGARKDEVVDRIDQVLSQVPGIQTMIGQPIEHRLSHILSGTPAALAVNLYGDDAALLRQVAERVRARLAAVPGAREVTAAKEAMVRSLPVRFRRADLRRFGLTPAAAAAQVQAGFQGAVAATVRQGRAVIDVVVRLKKAQRSDPEQLRQLILRGADGQLVRLHQVADIAHRRAPVVISRENGQRKAVVSCNIAAGHNLGHVVQQARHAIAPIAASAGVQVRFGGQFEAEQVARATLLRWGLVALLVVVVLLRVAMSSWITAAIVLLNVPLALIGGVAAVFIAQSDSVIGNLAALVGVVDGYVPPVLSVTSLVGFITLAGIAARNGILLLNHAHSLRSEGLAIESAIRQGSRERLVPILATALTAALGLAPLAIASVQPGSELLAPLAVVVLGGLLNSTLLNLFVVPVAWRWAAGRAEVSENAARLVATDGDYNVATVAEVGRR